VSSSDALEEARRNVEDEFDCWRIRRPSGDTIGEEHEYTDGRAICMHCLASQ